MKLIVRTQEGTVFVTEYLRYRSRFTSADHAIAYRRKR